MNFYIFSPGFSIWNPTNLFTSPAGKVLIGLAPFSHGIRYMYLWTLGTWKCNFASDFSVLNNILICNCLVLVQSYIASAKRYLVEQKILIWLACLVAIFWIVFSNSFLQSMAILRVLQKKLNNEKGPYFWIFSIRKLQNECKTMIWWFFG